MIGVLDIGSNTVLVLVLGADGRVLHEGARITRLGEGVFSSGSLAPAAIGRTREAVAELAAQARRAGARRLVAVGTEALRQARDGRQFLEGLRAEGWVDEVRLLGGDEEAELAIEAARRERQAAPICVIDVGGGSTEVAWTEAGRVRGVSLPLGSVRLTEAHLPHHPIPPPVLEAVRGEVRRVVAEGLRGAPRGSAREPIAVAGTATTLAALELRLPRYDAERVEGLPVACERLRAWTLRLAALSLEERRALPGMEPGRADVIVAGLVVLEEAVLGLGAARFRVSGRGVRYGVALRLLDGVGV